ncbi:TPA: hypothetical protein VHK49_001194 [Streptococcus pyogenes]|nr:hypothetical protein [Streptococcus pyogenes]
MDKELIIIDEKQYELKYNEKTIETVEALTGKAFMDVIVNNKSISWALLAEMAAM